MRKAAKYVGLVFGCNANPRVLYCELNGDRVLLAGHHAQRNDDLPVRCEFNGIATQIDEYLLQPHRITADDGGQRGINVK